MCAFYEYQKRNSESLFFQNIQNLLQPQGLEKQNYFCTVAASSLVLRARLHIFTVWSFEGKPARTLLLEDEAL
jgi:hypothetical protein